MVFVFQGDNPQKVKMQYYKLFFNKKCFFYVIYM